MFNFWEVIVLIMYASNVIYALSLHLNGKASKTSFIASVLSFAIMVYILFQAGLFRGA